MTYCSQVSPPHALVYYLDGMLFCLVKMLRDVLFILSYFLLHLSSLCNVIILLLPFFYQYTGWFPANHICFLASYTKAARDDFKGWGSSSMEDTSYD